MAKTLQFRRDTTANLASVTGAVGEIFIDTTKKTVVVMDGSTSGGFPLELQGAGTGATGIAGASGSIGVNGATGSAGTNGATGSAGTNGATGSAGTNGTDGATGSAGTNGATGSAGTNGATGSAGTNGATGVTGASGVGTDGATGSAGTNGATGVAGIQGSTGVQGPQGNFGGATFDYTFDSSTTASDPGAGKIRFNNATLSSATIMYIDASNDATTDLSTYLNTIDDSTSTIKGHFRISKKTDENAFALYTITSLTDNTGWFSVASSYVSGNSTFANSDDIIVTFQRTGDKGDTGLTGATGSAGTNGATGSAGTNGATGSAGATGAGVQGASGAAGASGVGGGASAGSTGFNGVLFVGATGASGANNGTLSVSGPILSTGGINVGSTGPVPSNGQLGVQTYLVVGSTGLMGATGSIIATGHAQVTSLGINTFPGASGSVTASSIITGTVGASGIQSHSIAIGASGATSPNSGTLSVSGPILSTGGLNVGSTGPSPQNGTLGVQTYLVVGSTGLMGATGSLIATGTAQVTSLGVNTFPGASGSVTASSAQIAFVGASGIRSHSIAIGASGATSPNSGTLSVSGPILSTGGINVGSTGPSPQNGTLGVQTYLVVGSTGLMGATGSIIATGTGQMTSLGVNTFPGASGSVTASSIITATIGASGIQSHSIAIGASGATSPNSGTLSVSGPILSTGGLNVGSTGPGPQNGTLGVQTYLIVGATGFGSGATGSIIVHGTGQFNSLGVGTAPGATGEIRATAEITAYYSSDSRLKENILPIDNALGKLRQLKGVMFDWKDDVVAEKGGEDGYFVRKHDTGVIAQEVEAVLPEVVAERADGFKAVRYEKLAGLIIQAINELADQVDALKK